LAFDREMDKQRDSSKLSSKILNHDNPYSDLDSFRNEIRKKVSDKLKLSSPTSLTSPASLKFADMKSILSPTHAKSTSRAIFDFDKPNIEIRSTPATGRGMNKSIFDTRTTPTASSNSKTTLDSFFANPPSAKATSYRTSPKKASASIERTKKFSKDTSLYDSLKSDNRFSPSKSKASRYTTSQSDFGSMNKLYSPLYKSYVFAKNDSSIDRDINLTPKKSSTQDKGLDRSIKKMSQEYAYIMNKVPSARSSPLKPKSSPLKSHNYGQNRDIEDLRREIRSSLDRAGRTPMSANSVTASQERSSPYHMRSNKTNGFFELEKDKRSAKTSKAKNLMLAFSSIKILEMLNLLEIFTEQDAKELSTIYAQELLKLSSVVQNKIRR